MLVIQYKIVILYLCVWFSYIFKFVFNSIRTLGVAALSLCYIAMGIVDAYYIEGPGISTWDIAAASLIISEAGGIVVDRVTGNAICIFC